MSRFGDDEPAAGNVTIGANTRIAYLDQARAGLVDRVTLARVDAEQAERLLEAHSGSISDALRVGRAENRET